MSIEIHCILIDLSQETILPHDVIGTGKEVSVSVSVSNHAKRLFQQNVVKSTMDQCSCVSAASANVNASAMIVSQLKIMEMKAAAAEAVVAYDELDSDEDTDKDTHADADANANTDTASFYWRCTALGCFRKKRNGISSTNSNSSRRNSRDKRSSSLSSSSPTSSTPPATTHDKEQKIEHEHISEIINDESDKEMVESTIQSVSKFLKVHDQFIAFTSVLLKSYLYHIMITSTMTTTMIASLSSSEASSENKNKFKFKTPKQIVILPRTKYGKPYLHIPIPKPKPSSLSSFPSSLSSLNIHTKKKNTNGRNKTRLMQKWNRDHGNEERQALVLKKEESELGLEQKESSSTSTTLTTITSSQIPFSVSHHYPFIGLAYMNTTNTNTNTNEHSMSKKRTHMKRNMMLGFDIVTFDSYAKTKHLYTSSDEFLNCFRSTFTAWEWSQIKGVVSDADAQMEDEEYNNQYNNGNDNGNGNGNGNGSIIHNEVVSDPTRVKEMLLRWAMKEAYTKGLGTGLGAEFGSFAIQLHGVDGDSHHWNNNNVNNSRNYGYGHGYGHGHGNGNGNGRPSSAGMTIRSESSASLTSTNTNTGGRIFDLIQHAEILGSGSGPGSMKDKKVHLKASIYHKEERNAKFWEFIFLPLTKPTTTTTTTTPGQKSGILGCACICAGPIETTTADPTGVDLTTELKLSSMSMQDLMEYHTGTSTPFASKK